MFPLDAFLVGLLPAAALAWAVLLVLARAFEHRLLFGRPPGLRHAPAGPYQRFLTERVTLWRDDCRIEGVVARPSTDALGINGSAAHTLLLWFGGRNENVMWTPALASWLGEGHAVAAFAYRERPTQRDVVGDALYALAWLREEPRFEGVRLMLAGRSLGSGVALQLAATLPAEARLRGLVLVSPMDSVRAMVGRHWLLAPFARWMSSPFDSLSLTSRMNCPVLVLLAERDTSVPHDRSMRLVHHLRQQRPSGTSHAVQIRVIAGTDHRTVARSADTLQAIAQFTDRLPG